MNQTWEHIWLKNSFKTWKPNRNACPLGKVKPTAKSLWPWNLWTDVPISQNSGNIEGVPMMAQGTTSGIFRASLWYEERSTCICTKQLIPQNQSVPSLSLSSGYACTRQRIIKTWQSSIQMEVLLHKKLATGQNIQSLSSLEPKGVMARQVAICWRGYSCQRKSLNRRKSNSIKGSKFYFAV